MKSEVKLNIFLRDGDSYLGCRAPNDDPFADKDGRLVRFFSNDSDSCIIIIPMDLIARLEIYKEKDLE